MDKKDEILIESVIELAKSTKELISMFNEVEKLRTDKIENLIIQNKKVKDKDIWKTIATYSLLVLGILTGFIIWFTTVAVFTQPPVNQVQQVNQPTINK